MISYSELRNIQKREIEGGSLVELPEDFFSQVQELMSQKEQDSKQGSIMALREFENIKRIISIIQAKREEKIVLMALRSEKSQIGLTKDEMDVFLKVQHVISQRRENLFGKKKETSVKKIKMLAQIEQYVGENNQLFGPFEKDKEYVVPHTEAEWMLKEKMAELTV